MHTDVGQLGAADDWADHDSGHGESTAHATVFVDIALSGSQHVRRERLSRVGLPNTPRDESLRPDDASRVQSPGRRA